MSLWERPRKLDLSPGLPGSRAQTLRSPALPLTASGLPRPSLPGSALVPEGTSSPSQWKFTPTAQPSCLKGGGWQGRGSSCGNRRLYKRTDGQMERWSPGLHL